MLVLSVMMKDGIWSMHEGHAVVVLHHPVLQGHNVILELMARDHIIVMVVKHHNMVGDVVDQDAIIWLKVILYMAPFCQCVSYQSTWQNMVLWMWC